MKLTLGASPCPNDCFIIDAIVHRRIDLEGLEFEVRLDDVETLNRAAFAGELDVTKLSYHAFAYCADRYVALNAGSALGRNCGPLLISKRPIAPEEVAGGGLAIAVPGKYTTAALGVGQGPKLPLSCRLARPLSMAERFADSDAPVSRVTLHDFPAGFAAELTTLQGPVGGITRPVRPPAPAASTQNHHRNRRW